MDERIMDARQWHTIVRIDVTRNDVSLRREAGLVCALAKSVGVIEVRGELTMKATIKHILMFLANPQAAHALMQSTASYQKHQYTWVHMRMLLYYRMRLASGRNTRL